MKKKLFILTMSLCLAFAGCGKEAAKPDANVQPSNNEIEVSNDDASENEIVEESVNDAISAENDTTNEEKKYKYEEYASMTPEEIVSSLTLEQKVAQMVEPAMYRTSYEEMLDNDYGAILSKLDGVTPTYDEWQEIVNDFQESAINSEAGIPFLYGQDDLHGVNYCKGAVYFPHNIGMGAANDPDLMYEIGLATADEAKLCHMLWNYAPVVAQSADPRWGRTYESFGSDLETIKSLATSYTKGVVDGGVIACAKHFFADGNVKYGTGENSDVERIIDRGDAILTDDEINELLDVYQAEIDAGVQTIMVSHSALNGVKMHENGEYIKKLKEEMGFTGYIVGDWNSVHNTSADTYEEQVINAINAGIDMLMEVDDYNENIDIIVAAVNDGRIPLERVDEAVTSIIRVKQNAGLFDDPMFENLETKQTETGSEEYRELAKKAVEESLVLLKNDNDLLPLKENTKVFLTGPAINNDIAQCGGWTMDWTGSSDIYMSGVTSIQEGFEKIAEENGIEVVNKIEDADVVILGVGEDSYAEWTGDTTDLELCGELGLDGNEDAINKVKESGKPVVTLIVAGRQVILGDAYEDWDSVVMCYLPGSEGEGVAEVLMGNADFTGKLPSPWYDNVKQIGTKSSWLERGYGLTYND